MSNHKSPESLPFVVCPRCAGHGLITNPAFDGVSPEASFGSAAADFVRELASGMHDVRCHECQGMRVVRDVCPCPACEDEREWAAVDALAAAAERRMGC